MDSPTLNADVTIDDSGTSGNVDLLDRIGLISRHIALLTAWIATCGSLFFSEVLGWVPCVLCWYQRILMYPLALLLAIGIMRRDRGLHTYILPFSIAGIAVSLYHHLLIKTDWLPPPACVSGVPCNVDYLNVFGFITIPWLALTAFVIITIMLAVYAWTQSALTDDWDDTVEEQFGWPRFHIDNASLGAGMIIVSVILAFLVGSTFV